MGGKRDDATRWSVALPPFSLSSQLSAKLDSILLLSCGWPKVRDGPKGRKERKHFDLNFLRLNLHGFSNFCIFFPIFFPFFNSVISTLYFFFTKPIFPSSPLQIHRHTNPHHLHRERRPIQLHLPRERSGEVQGGRAAEEGSERDRGTEVG